MPTLRDTHPEPEVHSEPEIHPEYGTVLVKSRFRPLYASWTLAIGLLFLLLVADAMFFGLITPPMEGSLRLVALGVILTIGIVATLSGLHQLYDPTVFALGTDRGLVVFRQDAPQKDALLIPWRRIERLDFEVHKLPSGIRQARVETVAVRVAQDEEFRVPEGFSHLLKAPPGRREPLAGEHFVVVHIDAMSGLPGGEELHQKLTAIWEWAR